MLIHPTAIIHRDARLADGVTVGPYAIIEDETEIGEGVEIRAHAVIKRFTRIGPETVIHEGAIISGEPQDLSYREARSYVRIGACGRIREGVTVHRGTEPESVTEIGDNAFLMAYSHVAHNCKLGDRVILANNVALAGHVEIGDRAFLSGGVVVHQFCRIGQLAMIGGNSKIVQDCLPFIITDGVPGRASGLNVVGLRRAGFTASDLAQLKQAYRTLLRAGLLLEDALAQLSETDHPAVVQLVEFIKGSRRGFCR